MVEDEATVPATEQEVAQPVAAAAARASQAPGLTTPAPGASADSLPVLDVETASLGAKKVGCACL